MPSYTESDCEWSAQAWNRFAPRRFELDAEGVRHATVASSLFEPACSCSQDGEFVACKWSPQGRLIGDGPAVPTLHITLISSPALLEWTVARAKELGATRLVLGAGHAHTYPGLPLVEDWQGGEALIDEMTRLGFAPEGELVVDVERDLKGYEPYPGCLEALDRCSAVVRPATAEDEDALEEFFLRTFPTRWRFDMMEKFRSGEPHQIDVLVKDGIVEGFSGTQDSTTKIPRAGAVWWKSLGENWCALGPIGVSERVRGMKLGGALLGASLQRLAAQGGRQCIIDWTTLVDFYGMHGFDLARVYQYWGRDLA